MLGVPAAARVVSGCDIPQDVPSYRVAAGYLVFVAFPLQQEEVRLQIDLGSTLFVESDGHLIVYTAAEALRPALCGSMRGTLAPEADAMRTVAAISQAN